MGRPVTKAAGNVYCKYRMRAAEWNDKFLSRAGASDVLPGVTEDSIKKYELPKKCRKNGEILPVPPQNLKESVNDYTLFENIPVKDYPLLLTFGDFFEME